MAELEDLFARAGSELSAAVTAPAATALRARGQARARRRAVSLGAASAVVLVAAGLAAVGAVRGGSEEESLVPAGPAAVACAPTSAADAARTPAEDPPVARGGQGILAALPPLATSSTGEIEGATVVVAHVVSMQAPGLTGGDGNLPYARPTEQRQPVSGDDPVVVRSVRFAVERTVQGSSPGCLDLDVPGGSTGTHVTQVDGAGSIPVTLRAGDRVLVVEQAGAYAVAFADARGLARMPLPGGSLVAVSTFTLPANPREGLGPEQATTGTTGRGDGQDLGFLTDVYGNMPDNRLRLVFDRVELLSGDAAEVAAAAAGQEAGNGSFLRNESTQTWDVPISPAVVVHGSTHLNPDRGIAPQRRDLSELLQFVQTDPRAKDTVFRWTVKDGEVVDIHEQYRP